MTENSQNIGVRCTNTSKIPPCDEYLSGALPKIVHPVPSLSFFLNTSTGADTNSGTNAGSPVLTLGRILALMENSSADVGIIEITSATLALGANPTIDLFPLAGRYGKIIFRGPKTTLATDTVAAAATYAPNLIGVNGTTAGYTAGAFAKKYIVNLTTAYDLRSAIITNTAGNISSIVSLTSSGYFDGTTLPWTALDAFQVFDISTVVTWSGTLNVIIEPMNRVFFDSLIMRPSANATFMYTPRAFDPQLIQFRSCQLESVGAALGVTYIGDYIIEGCYCLSALASDRILNFGALYAFNNYIERVGLKVETQAGIIAALFSLNSETGSAISVLGAPFLGAEISTSGGAGASIISVGQASIVQLRQLLLTSHAATGITIDRSFADISNATLTPVAGATNTIAIIRGSVVELLTVTTTDAGDLAAGLGINASDVTLTTVSLTGSSTNGISILNGSTVRNIGAVTVGSALAVGISVETGSHFTGNTGATTAGVGNGTVGMAVLSGSSASFAVRPTITGTTGNAFVGNAPGPQAVETWAAIAGGVPGVCNDFAVNPTQNCFIFTP